MFIGLEEMLKELLLLGSREIFSLMYVEVEDKR